MIAIRPFRDSDAETLARIFRRAVHEIACCDYSPAQCDAWAPAQRDIKIFVARRKAKPTFVAESGGHVAGFSDLEPDGHIDMLYVNPDFARRGVARALLDHIERLACAKNIARLHARASLTAKPVFERCGFRAVQPLTVELGGQSFSTWIVEKLL